ncbi:hypothetical protein [Streptomyces sp. NPDC088182]|uniref:hypothetical protein n=1 Tax=Streptomyces sp. NPDC088182 TaxID=3365838 RepID=UPI0038033E58
MAARASATALTRCGRTAFGAVLGSLVGDGVNPAAVTGRDEPTSGATRVGIDLDTEGAPADARGTAEVADAAGDRTTDGRAAVGATGVREAGTDVVPEAEAEGEAEAGTGAWAEGRGCAEAGARDDRCTGDAPSGRPDPAPSFTAGGTGFPTAKAGLEPGAGPAPTTGTDRVELTGEVGGAARWTSGWAAGRAAPWPPVTTGRVELADGVVLLAPPPPEPTGGRTGTPDTCVPPVAAGARAAGPESRSTAGRVGSERSPARAPAAGTASRRTGSGPPGFPVGSATTAETARVGTTGCPAAVPDPGTAPLDAVPEPEEREGSGDVVEWEEFEAPTPETEPAPETEAAPETEPAPAPVRRLPPDDAPSAASRRCTGGAGAGGVAGTTGVAGVAGREDGRTDGGTGAPTGPPSAGERCTGGVPPEAGAPAGRRAAGEAGGSAARPPTGPRSGAPSFGRTAGRGAGAPAPDVPVPDATAGRATAPGPAAGVLCTGGVPPLPPLPDARAGPGAASPPELPGGGTASVAGPCGAGRTTGPAMPRRPRTGGVREVSGAGDAGGTAGPGNGGPSSGRRGGVALAGSAARPGAFA